MPLKSGKGSMKSNMSELLSAYAEQQKIGNTRPKNAAHARRIAAAIAYKKERERT